MLSLLRNRVSSTRTTVIEAGISHLGENRPEGLPQKSRNSKGVVWHYIGNIQSRKVRDIVDNVSYLHSLVV